MRELLETLLPHRRGMASSMFVMVLVLSGIMGLQVGAEADSAATLREDLQTPSIDWDKQEQTEYKMLPDSYEQKFKAYEAWKQSLTPDWVSREVRSGVRGFTETIMTVAFGVARSAALFGYEHREIMSHWIIQTWLQLAGYSTVFAFMGLQIKRVWNIKEREIHG